MRSSKTTSIEIKWGLCMPFSTSGIYVRSYFNTNIKKIL